MADITRINELPRSSHIASVKRVNKKRARYNIRERLPYQKKTPQKPGKSKKNHIDVYA